MIAIQQLWKQAFLSDAAELELLNNAKSVIDSLDDETLYIVSSENCQLVHTEPQLDLVLRRCKAVFGSPSVLHVKRSQVDILRSLYDMYPFDVYSKSGRYMDFDEWLNSFLDPEMDNKLRDFLKFDSVLSKLEQSFGSDRVHVLDFTSLFKRKSSSDIDQLATLLKIPSVELVTLLAKRKNGNLDHQLSHVSRKLFCNFHLSDYLPSSLVRSLGMRLTSLLISLGWSKPPSNISEQASKRISHFYGIQ